MNFTVKRSLNFAHPIAIGTQNPHDVPKHISQILRLLREFILRALRLPG
jgi:hypothetical protein